MCFELKMQDAYVGRDESNIKVRVTNVNFNTVSKAIYKRIIAS